MEGYSIAATDGIIGDVKDYYFDDAAWVIRYLVFTFFSGCTLKSVD
jgi:hypothetical protein